MRYKILGFLISFSMLFGQINLVPGDLTGEGTIDILDIIGTVGIILQTQTPTDDQLWSGDFNWDGVIDILDIIGIVDAVLYPVDCGGDFVCPDNPFECCTDFHSTAGMNCYMCHSNTYNNTTSPDHSAQEFPTDYCTTCHNPVVGWSNPIWQHRYLDIYCNDCHQPAEGHMESMGHGGGDCMMCHPSFDGFENPSCTDCHDM